MTVSRIGPGAAAQQGIAAREPVLSTPAARKFFHEMRAGLAPRLTAANAFTGKDRDSALSIVSFTRPGGLAKGSEAAEAYAEAAHAFVAWAKSAYPSHKLVVGHKIKVDDDFGDWVDRIKIAVIT